MSEENRFIRVGEVARMTGMAVVTVWRKAKSDDDFPKPIKVSESVTAWNLTEIVDWMRLRPRASIENKKETPLTRVKK